MRRLSVLFLLSLVVASSAFAVAPQFWRIRSADEFLAGEIEGFAVTSRGELRAAPAVRKIASFNDPFVLSQIATPGGDHYFGTGNDGKVYRLRGTELKPVYTAPEPEVYAIAFRDGALYVGTSPNGKVYRVDPDNGKATTFFDPQQAYIWSMLFLPNGDLAVATGVDGKLFRVPSSGQGKVWFDSPDTHVRTMALRPNGALLAGASGKGRIYAVNADGSAHALYDSSLNEISSIYVDSTGTGWAAGVSNVLPSSAPKAQPKPAQQQQNQQQQQQGSAQSSDANKQEASANVEVSFSFEDPTSSQAPAGTGELYRINSDDFVEVVRKFEREMVYAINGGRDGAILLSTGPQGRIYEVRDGEAALIANVPEKQVVSISNSGGNTVVTTTNSGAVYRLDKAVSTSGEFRSAAKDVERFSRFGTYRLQGNGLNSGAVAVSFRSGNTRNPDGTWSAWTTPASAVEGPIGAPAGRYLQWKLTTAKGPADFVIDGVTIAFVNRNVAPVIDAISVQDPAVVFITGGYPASQNVVEATNPDEYGIFSSLEPAREKNDPGKRMFRKGFRTIMWRAHDDNGDNLRYTVSFREKGSNRWLRLRENIDETQVNFDTSQLPDGTYEIRVVATDASDNPDMPLETSKEGIEFQIDNTPPSVSSAPDGDDVLVRVTDRMSPVGRVEYSADAEKWIRLTAADGIADSSEETFRIPKSAVTGRFVIVRAVDAFYNVDTESISVR